MTRWTIIALALCGFIGGCAASPQEASVREIERGIFSAHAETLWTPAYAWPSATGAAQQKCGDAQMVPVDRKEERILGTGSNVDLIFRCVAYSDNSPEAAALREKAGTDAARQAEAQAAAERQQGLMLLQAQQALRQQQMQQAPKAPTTTNCVALGNTLNCNSY